MAPLTSGNKWRRLPLPTLPWAVTWGQGQAVASPSHHQGDGLGHFVSQGFVIRRKILRQNLCMFLCRSGLWSLCFSKFYERKFMFRLADRISKAFLETIISLKIWLPLSVFNAITIWFYLWSIKCQSSKVPWLSCSDWCTGHHEGLWLVRWPRHVLIICNIHS